jgi:hypothetical protein
MLKQVVVAAYGKHVLKIGKEFNLKITQKKEGWDKRIET